MEVGSSSLPGTTHRRQAMCSQGQNEPGTTSSLNGGLAQLARAPALQAGGQRFESVILHLGCDSEYSEYSDYSEVNSLAFFDILKAKAKCKANLHAYVRCAIDN